MALDEHARPDDTVVTADGIRIAVDPVSASYLEGAEIHFVDTLMGGGFTVRNPNATDTCGCGRSFRTAKDPGTPKQEDGGCGCR